MSRFRRDRKQMTRKRKIGRRKKTKVRRAPIKLKKWYDKRQKPRKKGDGTYRGGRGRKPRQHKRPRNYKPPQNETSDYDYYDEDGNIKVPSGETQEGSDDAAYVSYGTGEYADTAEAEAAHQELEKEYQMQLVRERKRAERRRLANGTVESTEEILSLPLVESKESKKSVSNTTKDGEEEDSEEYYDEEDSSEYEEDDESSSSSGGGGGGGGKTNKGKADKHMDGKLKSTTKITSKTNKHATNKFQSFEKTMKSVEQQINKATDKIKYPENPNNQQVGNKHLASQTKTKQSQNIRLTAKKLNFMSQSVIPGYRNSLHSNQPLNWMPSAKFRIAQDKLFKTIQSKSEKKVPDVNSITMTGLASTGGKNMQSLQSKKEYRVIESTSHDKKLNLSSIAGHKMENDQTYTSTTKDKKKKLTSIGRNSLKKIQSIALDPLVLTSIARHIPDLEVDTKEEKDPKNKLKVETKTSGSNSIGLGEKKSIDKHEEIPVKVKREIKVNKNHKINLENKKENRILKMQSSDTYDEELSFEPEKDLGISVPSDEIESAPDDETKTSS